MRFSKFLAQPEGVQLCLAMAGSLKERERERERESTHTHSKQELQPEVLHPIDDTAIQRYTVVRVLQANLDFSLAQVQESCLIEVHRNELWLRIAVPPKHTSYH